MSHARLISLAALLLAAACAPLPPDPRQITIDIPSPNHEARRPNFVILHHTSDDSAAEALQTLTDPARKVSAHYLIGRDGTLYRLVAEERRAWHAGESFWGGSRDMNSASIGIELDNNGSEPFAEPQIERLLTLLGDLKARYQIPVANFLGHADVAPRRKSDPSRHFPWQRLAAAGFGLWCESPTMPAVSATPADPGLALRALGYEPADIPAALQAFRRHFRGLDADAAATPEDMAVLQCLLAQQLTNGETRSPAAAPH